MQALYLLRPVIYAATVYAVNQYYHPADAPTTATDAGTASSKQTASEASSAGASASAGAAGSGVWQRCVAVASSVSIESVLKALALAASFVSYSSLLIHMVLMSLDHSYVITTHD